MCEPITISALASYAAIGGAAVSAYGAYSGAKEQKQSMMYQSQVTDNNAIIANNNAITADNNAKRTEEAAKNVEARGQQDLINARRENDRFKGAQRTNLAARGLDLNEGTPLSLQEQTDFFGEVDQVNLKNNTAQDAWRVRADATSQSDSANMLRYDSGMLRSNAKTMASKSRSISPGLAAGTSLLSSAGNVADKWYKPKSRG